MKSRILITLALLGLAGCNTFEKRAEEKAEVFNQLDPATKDKLSRAVVEIGFSPDLVFIALGKPDSKSERVTEEGRSEVWVYNSYYSEYRGSEIAGYRRIVDYDPFTKRYYVYYEPVRVEVYQDHVEDRIRITFKDDKVTVIEQAK